MSDLKSFVALQARVCEFLDRQDEATLRKLASGAAQLVVMGAAEAPLPARDGLRAEPSGDPLEVAQVLSRASSAQERRTYLEACGLTAKNLKTVAKARGLRNYSDLKKEEVTDLLVGQRPVPSDTTADEPKRTPVTEDPMAKPAAVPAEPDAGAAVIAARLREIDTEDEGAEYLQAQHLDRDGLLAVATELQLTRMDRLSQKELRRRILKQAIGARRKFAGLRKW